MRLSRMWALVLVFVYTFSQSTETPSVPAFKVVSPSGQTSLLIGTMHVPHAALRQPAGSVLDGARSFVIEHTVHDEQFEGMDLEVIAGLKEGRDMRASWARNLSEQQFLTLMNRANCALPNPMTRAQFENVLKLRTARIAAMLALLPCAPAGYRSRDDLLEQAARDRHVPVVALETQNEVSKRRADIPASAYASSIRYGTSIDVDAFYVGLVNALNLGDFDAVERSAAVGIEDPADRELFTRTMLVERNLVWMTKLPALFDQGHAVVAVGAAHLGGPQGLPALLTKQGYKVEPTMLPAAE